MHTTYQSPWADDGVVCESERSQKSESGLRLKQELGDIKSLLSQIVEEDTTASEEMLTKVDDLETRQEASGELLDTFMVDTLKTFDDLTDRVDSLEIDAGSAFASKLDRSTE